MIDRLLGWTVHKMSTIFMIRYSSFPMKMALMTEVSRRKIEKYIKKPTVTSLFVIDWLLQFAWILLYFLLETFVDSFWDGIVIWKLVPTVNFPLIIITKLNSAILNAIFWYWWLTITLTVTRLNSLKFDGI